MDHFDTPVHEHARNQVKSTHGAYFLHGRFFEVKGVEVLEGPKQGAVEIFKASGDFSVYGLYGV